MSATPAWIKYAVSTKNDLTFRDPKVPARRSVDGTRAGGAFEMRDLENKPIGLRFLIVRVLTPAESTELTERVVGGDFYFTIDGHIGWTADDGRTVELLNPLVSSSADLYGSPPTMREEQEKLYRHPVLLEYIWYWSKELIMNRYGTYILRYHGTQWYVLHNWIHTKQFRTAYRNALATTIGTTSTPTYRELPDRELEDVALQRYCRLTLPHPERPGVTIFMDPCCNILFDGMHCVRSAYFNINRAPGGFANAAPIPEAVLKEYAEDVPLGGDTVYNEAIKPLRCHGVDNSQHLAHFIDTKFSSSSFMHDYQNRRSTEARNIIIQVCQVNTVIGDGVTGGRDVYVQETNSVRSCDQTVNTGGGGDALQTADDGTSGDEDDGGGGKSGEGSASGGGTGGEDDGDDAAFLMQRRAAVALLGASVVGTIALGAVVHARVANARAAE